MSLKTWAFGEVVASADLNGNFTYLENLINFLVPIGSTMLFNDFNGVLSVSGTYWTPENGTTVTDPDSLLNGKTLDDVSGRYVVGFGSDGGGDIDSAAWSAGAVGNTGHVVDLSAVGAAHTHGVGSLQFQTGRLYSAAGNLEFYMFDSSGSDDKVLNISGLRQSGASNMTYTAGSNRYFYTKSGTGITSSDGTGGSATQSIQPRSVKKRSYIRFK